MTNRHDFLDFISPPVLFLAAGIFLFFTALLVVMIYAELYRKKRLFFGRQKINEQLNAWISEALVEETVPTVKVRGWLRHYFRNEEHRHHVMDTLINVKKNLSGAASNNINAIYEQLGLKKDSLFKLKSLKWHMKARGIYELYMMGQSDAIHSIAKFTDSRNETVRMEAQTATVGFKGFEGLNFLSNLTQPLNEWQQLKLLEQLEKLDVQEMPELPSWLVSQNSYVQLFALKLADIYLQLHVHDLVVSSLDSDKENIRSQAIKTLGRIANENTAGILKDHYRSETNINKRTILRQLSELGGDDDRSFLLSQLQDGDDSIKLEAGRAIARIGYDGWEVLLANVNDDETLLSISRQIKYELAR